MTNVLEYEEAINLCEKIIYSIINKYRYIDKDDLYQVATLGVMAACDNFDSSKNVSFTSYAYLYILGQVKKYIANNRTLKVSKEYNSLYILISKTRNLLTQQLKKEPSVKDIADYLKMDIQLVYDVSKVNVQVDSLDSTDINKYDIIEKKNNNLDMETLIMLKEKLNNLKSDEKKIIIDRYYNGKTQEEIAVEIGSSQVNVYRKEKKILTNLKNNW